LTPRLNNSVLPFAFIIDPPLMQIEIETAIKRKGDQSGEHTKHQAIIECNEGIHA
jgi:hypothetical protein